jgi:hypothetical protein
MPACDILERWWYGLETDRTAEGFFLLVWQSWHYFTLYALRGAKQHIFPRCHVRGGTLSTNPVSSSSSPRILALLKGKFTCNSRGDYAPFLDPNNIIESITRSLNASVSLQLKHTTSTAPISWWAVPRILLGAPRYYTNLFRSLDAFLK